ncbi:MAG: hypothetical protein LUQ65_10580 [Candidatus Helarchaeota archaeon]|nr:hypothetical protein [Candidatus Helarchaeota archaeon]
MDENNQISGEDRESTVETLTALTKKSYEWLKDQKKTFLWLIIAMGALTGVTFQQTFVQILSLNPLNYVPMIICFSVILIIDVWLLYKYRIFVKEFLYWNKRLSSHQDTLEKLLKAI